MSNGLLRKSVRNLSKEELRAVRKAYRGMMSLRDNRGYNYLAGHHGVPGQYCWHHQRASGRFRGGGAGGLVNIFPGEKHWHGASPGSGMTHIAVNINATTTWMERVTKEQFSALSL